MTDIKSPDQIRPYVEYRLSAWWLHMGVCVGGYVWINKPTVSPRERERRIVYRDADRHGERMRTFGLAHINARTVLTPAESWGCYIITYFLAANANIQLISSLSPSLPRLSLPGFSAPSLTTIRGTPLRKHGVRGLHVRRSRAHKETLCASLAPFPERGLGCCGVSGQWAERAEDNDGVPAWCSSLFSAVNRHAVPNPERLARVCAIQSYL